MHLTFYFPPFCWFFSQISVSPFQGTRCMFGMLSLGELSKWIPVLLWQRMWLVPCGLLPPHLPDELLKWVFCFHACWLEVFWFNFRSQKWDAACLCVCWRNVMPPQIGPLPKLLFSLSIFIIRPQMISLPPAGVEPALWAPLSRGCLPPHSCAIRIFGIPKWFPKKAGWLSCGRTHCDSGSWGAEGETQLCFLKPFSTFFDDSLISPGKRFRFRKIPPLGRYFFFWWIPF